MSIDKSISSKDFRSIDLFKFIFAICIVCIHALPFESISSLLDNVFVGIVCRLAVPFFFMASGFFMFLSVFKIDGNETRKFKKYISNIIILYLKVSVVYILIDIILGNKIIISNIIKNFLSGKLALQLWYFPALIISTTILFFWYRKSKLKHFYLITGILYIIGLLGTTYYSSLNNINYLKSGIDILISIFGTTRNGVFFALIFVGMGINLAKLYIETNYIEKVSIKKTYFKVAILFLLMSIEALAVAILLPNINGRDMFLLLPTLSYFIFILILKIDNYLKGDRRLYKILRKLSTLIFILHVGVLYFINVENSLVRFFLTIGITLILSFIILFYGFIKDKGLNKISLTKI